MRRIENPTMDFLCEEAFRLGAATPTQFGALAVTTGKHTGRAPKDKFVVRAPATENSIWWGEVNRPFEPARFEELGQRLREHLARRDTFVFRGSAGADPAYRRPIELTTESAWHALFAMNMFLPSSQKSDRIIEILHATSFCADPTRDGTHSEAFVILNLDSDRIPNFPVGEPGQSLQPI